MQAQVVYHNNNNYSENKKLVLRVIKVPQFVSAHGSSAEEKYFNTVTVKLLSLQKQIYT